MSHKVGIVGVGNVGSHVASELVKSSMISDLVLIDNNKVKSDSDGLDLYDSLAYSLSNINISVNDYSMLKDADIVVISVGRPPSTHNSRLEVLSDSASRLDEVVPKITASGFNGIYVVITNPCDIMTYYTLKKSGVDWRRVIGTGTMLDSARFKYILGKRLNVDPKSINGLTIGEHGDSQIVPWSCIQVGYDQIDNYIEKNSINLDKAALHAQTVDRGYVIAQGKGATYFGIAAAAMRLIRAILNNENSILPVSSYIQNIYDTSDLCISLPCIINRGGIFKQVPLSLTNEEIEGFKHSASVVKEAISQVYKKN